MTKKPKQLEVRYLPIKALKPWKDNPRLNDEAVAGIVRSIEQFGYTNPILVRKADKRIIAGHTRVKALQQVGETHVPAIVLDLSEQDADTYAIFDNKSVENTPWDLPKLADVMGRLQELGVDTELTGFSADEVSAMLAPPYEPDAADDEVPEPPAEPVTKRGDLWLLGEHRLLCGDSTDANDVARLMGQERAGLCFTSPPYAQQRDYTEASKAKVADWDGLMRGVFGNLPMTEDGQVLVNLGLVHRDGEWIPYWDGWIEWMRAKGWRRFGWYVWDQGAGFPGDFAGRCAPSHEFLFHFNKERTAIAKHVATKSEGQVRARGRMGANGWQAESGNCRATGAMKIPDSVWRINRAPDGNIEHPAKFPVGLPLFAMDSWPSEVCYEPFAGSGTTVIATEKLGRRCFGLEIEPKYCDVIVQRWETLTGQKARRA